MFEVVDALQFEVLWIWSNKIEFSRRHFGSEETSYVILYQTISQGFILINM